MTAGSDTESVARHNRARIGLLSSLAVAAILIVPATAFAAKGGGTPAPAWIALSSVSGLSSAAAQPQLGVAVKFSSGYPSTTRNPWVSLSCYQDDALVFTQGGAPGSDFLLGGGSSTWLTSGGGATCRAELGDFYWRGGHQYYTYLAHTNFDAAG